MATTVIMPKQGQSVETCIITKWFKNKGEAVSAGDILFSYETDKAAFDVESSADGILLDIFFGDGAEVPVLANVAVIGKSGEETQLFNPDQSLSEPVKTKVEVKEENTLLLSANEKIRISPRAKRMANDKGLNYDTLQGSGPNGRIIASDIEKVLSLNIITEKTIQTNGVEFTEQPLSNVRKLIARAMHSSLQNAAQLTHHM